MICFCEELDESKYGQSGKIAVLENKTAVLKAFGLKSERWITLLEIDSRLLTLFYQSLDPAFDWFVVVYDYQAFCSDPEIKEAILWHELGHIQHPVHEHQHNLESEIQCDHLAVVNGYKNGIGKVLELTLKMANRLNNDLLAKMTSERQMKLLG